MEAEVTVCITFTTLAEANRSNCKAVSCDRLVPTMYCHVYAPESFITYTMAAFLVLKAGVAPNMTCIGTLQCPRCPIMCALHAQEITRWHYQISGTV